MSDKRKRAEDIRRTREEHALMVRDLSTLAQYLDGWIERGWLEKPEGPISPVEAAIRLLEEYRQKREAAEARRRLRVGPFEFVWGGRR